MQRLGDFLGGMVRFRWICYAYSPKPRRETEKILLRVVWGWSTCESGKQVRSNDFLQEVTDIWCCPGKEEPFTAPSVSVYSESGLWLGAGPSTEAMKLTFPLIDLFLYKFLNERF